MGQPREVGQPGSGQVEDVSLELVRSVAGGQRQDGPTPVKYLTTVA